MKKQSNVLSVNEIIKLIGVSHLNPEVKPKSFLLVGESGIGKTEGIEELASILNIGYYNIRTPEIEPYDLVGVWDPKENKYNTPLLPRSNEPAVILLDEINRGQIPTMQACMRIMEGRGTSTYKYDKNIHTIVAAANPVSEDDVVEILGRALINRPYIVFIEPDLSEWVSWINKNKKDISGIKEMVYPKEQLQEKIHSYHKKISMFLMTYPKYFIGKGTPEGAAKFEAVPNPRNWYEAAKIMVLFEAAGIDRTIPEIIGTKVGFTSAVDFYSFIQDPEPPVSGTEILKEYSKHMARFKKHQKESRSKAVASVHDLSIILSNDSHELSKSEIDNLKSFINSVDDNNQELAMTLLRNISTQNFNILIKAIPEFVKKNMKLIEEIKKKEQGA